MKWIVVPFNTAFAPGPKKFDFDINQISSTPARAKAVDFSDSYYDVNQALVVVKGTKIASATSIAALKPYKFGAQLGTTSYDYIVNNIKPSKQPAVFDTNDAAVAALKNKQIDGLVVDLPTAFYVDVGAGPERQDPGPVPDDRDARALRHGLREGQLARQLRQRRAGAAPRRRHAEEPAGQVAPG